MKLEITAHESTGWPRYQPISLSARQKPELERLAIGDAIPSAADEGGPVEHCETGPRADFDCSPSTGLRFVGSRIG